jgi:hypothetical protein
MLHPLEQKLFKNFEELLDSEYKINYQELIHFDYQNNAKYQKALDDKRIIEVDLNFGSLSNQSVENKMAVSQPCKYSKNLIDKLGNRKSYLGVYRIPEAAYIDRENLFVAPLHPYLDEFQRIMDWSFEAGLPIAWEIFYYEAHNEYYTPDNFTKETDISELILDFSEILPFFLILAFGFSIALFAFLGEIFHHDFISKIYLRQKFANFVAKIFIKKIKVLQNTFR